ncbi:MAG: rod shape-determining protein MreC [Bacteroidota bacterium]
MQELIKTILRFKVLITFTALCVISLSLISLGEVSKISGFRAVVIASISNIQKIFSWVPNPVALRSENQALRDLNLQLSSEVIKMRGALIENNRLRSMLALKDTSSEKLIPAEVVNKTNVQMRSYVTINKGTRDGLREGMAVRTDAGLVGEVVATTNRYSLVETLNNRHVKVSAKILRNQIDGILSWEGGNYLVLNNIPTSFEVYPGDMIVTSNYSVKYPHNIPIGKVVKVEKEYGSLFHKIFVEPYANFASLEQVYVIDYIVDEEIIELTKKIEETIKAKNRLRK